MIIYGSRAKQLARETISDSCPHCQTSNCIDMYVFQRYAHIFWIPFFPVGKTGASRCAHCKQALKLKEMPPYLRIAYDNVAARTRTPVWTFIGVAIVGVLIINGIIQSGMHDARMSELVKSPQVGDILEIKKGAGLYTLYKVMDVRPDSVAVLPLRYTVNQQSGLSELESGKYAQYSDEPKMYSRENLSVLLHAGEILDVIRK
jgi:hypothetical protein